MKRLLRILVIVLLSIVAFASILAIVYAFLPKGPRAPLAFDDPTGADREPVTTSGYAAVTGSPWATGAATTILDAGGNAFDAAVAALLMLNVTNGEAASFPSIAPTMIYLARDKTVRSYVGAGTAPEAATIEFFTDRGYDAIPDLNILSQLVPASPDVIVRLLTDYGTMSFGEVARPAIDRARMGFPVTRTMAGNLNFSLVERLGFSVLLPYNAKVYLRGQPWRPVSETDRFTRPDLAGTWDSLAEAEQTALALGASRAEALGKVRDYFYEGPLAQAILDLHERKGGLFSAVDLARYSGRWEPPVTGSYGRYTFLTNGGWTQGITGLMALNILDGMDLAPLGHNTPAYVHTVTQALELAFADRDAYVGDPEFVDIPSGILLSDAFAAERRRMMTPLAFGGLPHPGSVDGYRPYVPPANPVTTAAAHPAAASVAAALDFAIGKDTSQLVVVDSSGNAVVMTPSDFPKSPMVPETGMTLGNRMVQFRLDPASPTSLAPGKRPRVTPHAIIVLRDGEFWMGYSTPGGDMQSQALVQVFLNMEIFGMSLQDAINAPRFRTRSVPSSFSPHESEPGTLWLERSLYRTAGVELAAYGYDVVKRPERDHEFGAVGAIIREGRNLIAAADPREATWAAGE